jgi:hypothetical protein
MFRMILISQLLILYPLFITAGGPYLPHVAGYHINGNLGTLPFILDRFLCLVNF